MGRGCGRLPALMDGSTGIDRRGFVSLAGAGLMLGLAPSGAAAQEESGGLTRVFLKIDGDGVVTVYAKHLDMGQGIWSGLASIVAEELDADWAAVRVEGAPARMPDYGHLFFGAQTTGGSTSIANSWDQLREAGAVARAMLVQAAAAAWKVPADTIRIEKGMLSSGTRSAGFGAFAAAAGRLPAPKATPKPRSAYRLLGKPTIDQLDRIAKSTGAQLYGMDGGWPDLKIALVARAPRLGAALKSADMAAARAIAGVREVVEIPTGVAVVADTTWQAMKARKLLNPVWDESRASPTTSDGFMHDLTAMMDARAPDYRDKRGDPDSVFAHADRVVEATFEFPYLAHAPMEPLSLMGRMEGRRCRLRGGFQSQTANQQAVAKVLSLPDGDVILETIAAGGSFGRRAAADSDWVVEIAHLLRATAGRWAIKLMRTREDDMAAFRYRPQVRHRLRGALDASGRPLAIAHQAAGEGVFAHLIDIVPDLHRSSVMLGNAFDLYGFPAGEVAWWRPRLDIPVETFRGISNNHMCVAKEIFVDRLARAARADPVAFRLALLKDDPRQHAVLERAAEMIGWNTPPASGRMRGVAVHKADSSYVAQIAEISGTPADFRIERVVCAVDVGVAVNPDILRAQVEGGIGFALSNAFHSELTVALGAAVETNFDAYRVLRMDGMPSRIDIAIIESDAPPTGIGEPGSVLAGAAVINALERMGAPLVTRFPYRPA
ncbi:molybdopterin-dependent oxidoreductase [Sphingobium sp. H39-3-25]|uniref:xanthine dehydrogenase family protein molybdopterin-binding subunit n=1 Tax=Sphingobium arseniciresistens TaxID=3030834 RepID=UPI0023B8916B|nr:molybdopterin-dependent oxidoreductase [Sphingobium arseniciresistens]